MSNINQHNYPFIVNDIAFVISDTLTIREGLVSLLPTDQRVTYGILMIDTQTIEYFNFYEMFGLYSLAEIHIQQFLVTPTPSVSISTTPNPTRTPISSSTPSPTPTASYINHPNLLDTGTAIWTAVNGINNVLSDNSIEFISSALSVSDIPIFNTTTSVLPKTTYILNVDLNQGTCRNIEFEILSNQDAKIYSLNNDNEFFGQRYQDSNNLNLKINTNTATELQINVKLYSDLNNNACPAYYTFKLTNLNMKFVSTTMVTPTPSPTLTCTPTPSPSYFVEIPDGFDWMPPINIIKHDNIYSTDYNSTSFMPTTTADLWVSTTGNDSTGTGTQASPYASIKKALIQADTLPDEGVHIHINTGLYTSSTCWGGQSPNKNLIVTAEGGVVYSSTKINVTWTLQGDGTYSATRASAFGIYDTTNINSHGYPTLLNKVADQATCSSTPNSWAQVGTLIYINTFDSRLPTNSTINVLATVANGLQSVNKNWYISGIIFEGGNASGSFYTPTAGAGGSLTFEDCTFRFNSGTTQGNGLSIFGCTQVVNVRTSAYNNIADGLNYHVGQSNLISPKSIEIDCQSYDNGIADSVNNDNGSTSHDNCRIVRCNTISSGNIGPIIADVGTSQSWNLGVIATNSRGTVPDDESNSAYYSSDTAIMWLDGCTGSSYYSTVASGTSIIYIKNCNLTGNSFGSIINY